MTQKGARVFFGSLAEQLKHDNQQPPDDVDPMATDLPDVPVAATMATQAVDRMDIGEDAQASIRKRQALVREVEMMNRGHRMIVPTEDAQVRKRLRSVGEPITLFGEGPADRRDRLRQIMVKMELSGQAMVDDSSEQQIQHEEEEEEQTETFYSPGHYPKEIRQARMDIAKYSLENASQRLQKQQELYKNYTTQTKDVDMEKPETIQQSAYLTEQVEQKKRLFGRLKTFANTSSEVGDVRPLSAVTMSSQLDNAGRQLVLTGSWTGIVKMWSMDNSKLIRTFRGHEERITGLDMQPNFPNAQLFATGGADAVAKLWKLTEDEDADPLVATLEGHEDRLGKIGFHPSGRYLGTTSFDATWGLWDVERAQMLYEQEGHSMPVYDIAFHPDGGLAATTDLGGIALIWDLRTGRNILPLQGHVHQILSVDFSPNGYHAITGSDDHTCRVWDLRTKKCLYTLPAHNKLISHVQYEPDHGRYFITCSYDSTIKIWNSVEFKLVKVINEIDSRILCADLGRHLIDDKEAIVVGTYDKTWKVATTSKIQDKMES